VADKSLDKKVLNATKWSTSTQIAARIITPIMNMILARILVPEAFGVIATITMIISFTEMFTDSGFQKYLVQHEFKSEKEKIKSANVAFWTNFSLAIFLWTVISLFSDQIAIIVGNPGLGLVIIVACAQLPLTSFSSTQMALYRRSFDFKTLFIVRVIGIFIPLIVTIPLALIGFNYWSLIIGNICMQIFNAVFLTVKSPWKPEFYYNFTTLKNMLSFSIWSLVEDISIWLTVWVDAFIIGYYLNEYYLGIYRTSTTMVNALLSLITASIVPVMFAALSRLQHNHDKFKEMYFQFQKYVAILVLPIGIGVYLYSDLATSIMLGDQWTEASEVIGLWALTSSIMIVFGHFASEAYRSKGKPKLSFIAQVLHLIVLVPTCIIAASYGFWELVYARSFIRLQFVLVHIIILKVAIEIGIWETLKNIIPSLFTAIIMGVFATVLKTVSTETIWSLLSILLSIIFYFGILMLFPNMRADLLGLYKRIVPSKRNGS